MKSDATEVKAYLAGLPEDRVAAMTAIREVILEHLPKGYEEAIGFEMICYQVPLSVVPRTYNGLPLMYAALASQKRHMALYLMCAYQSPAMTAQLREGFRQAGKRLDMGKSCIRFKRLSDLPLGVIGRAIAAVPMKEFVESMDEILEKPTKPKAAPARKPAARPAAKPPVTKASRPKAPTTKKWER